jgi:hypothetical protein
MKDYTDYRYIFKAENSQSLIFFERSYNNEDPTLHDTVDRLDSSMRRFAMHDTVDR